MQVDFTKMHGAGNDFVVLDERVRPLGLVPGQMASLADRRTGIGCDQLIVLQPSREPGTDAFIRFFNRDGTESGACGNGTRCAAALIGAETGRSRILLGGLAGPLPAEILPERQVRVDMGTARLDSRDVPLSEARNTLELELPGNPAACSIGNPHATLFLDRLDGIDVARDGAALARHALFVEGCNVGFAQVRSWGEIRLVVWERGSGLTPACGSGACAALVNAHRRGLTGRDAAVEMPGGLLRVTWREDGHVLLTGPTATVFAGRISLS